MRPGIPTNQPTNRRQLTWYSGEGRRGRSPDPRHRTIGQAASECMNWDTVSCMVLGASSGQGQVATVSCSLVLTFSA